MHARNSMKERPDLLTPHHQHQKCAAKLAARLAVAWEEAGEPAIDRGTLFFVLPEGGQRKHDVFRCSAAFTAGGLTRYIDSWNTMTEMIRRGVSIQYDGETEFGIPPAVEPSRAAEVVKAVVPC